MPPPWALMCTPLSSGQSLAFSNESRCGMPLGYEVFAGNRADVTTLEEIVGVMEARYGKANRIWALVLRASYELVAGVMLS